MSEEPVLPRIRPEIAALPAYRQGRQASPDAFKLSSNENPFEPLPGVLEAVVAAGAFNRYPDATAARLRERLAARYGVSPDEVHVGAAASRCSRSCCSRPRAPATRSSTRGARSRLPLARRGRGGQECAGALTADSPSRPPAMAAAVTERTRLVIVRQPQQPHRAHRRLRRVRRVRRRRAARRARRARRGLRRVRHRSRFGRGQSRARRAQPAERGRAPHLLEGLRARGSADRLRDRPHRRAGRRAQHRDSAVGHRGRGRPRRSRAWMPRASCFNV